MSKWFGGNREEAVHETIQAYTQSIGHMPDEKQVEAIERTVDKYLSEDDCE
jgi:hypothetical protein